MKKKFISRLALTLVLMLMFSSVACLSVSAEKIDYSKQCSFMLTLKDRKGSSAVGKEIFLYKIANIKDSGGKTVYVYTKEFEDCKTKLNSETVSSFYAPDEIYDFIESSNLRDKPLMKKTTDKNGRAVFERLSVGLYIVFDNNGEKPVFRPFIFSLPGEDGYNISAAPKVDLDGTSRPSNPDDNETTKPSGSDPSDPSGSTDPNDPSNPGDTTDPNDPSNPGDTTDPNDPSNPGDTTDPNDPSNPGDTTDPNDPSNPGDTTDPNDPSNPGDPGDPNDPSDPGKKPSKPTLPHTGQMNWPVPILIVCGLLLFSLGFMLYNAPEKKKNEG